MRCLQINPRDLTVLQDMDGMTSPELHITPEQPMGDDSNRPHVPPQKKGDHSGLFRDGHLFTEPDRVFGPVRRVDLYFRLELVLCDKVHEFETEGGGGEWVELRRKSDAVVCDNEVVISIVEMNGDTQGAGFVPDSLTVK